MKPFQTVFYDQRNKNLSVEKNNNRLGREYGEIVHSPKKSTVLYFLMLRRPVEHSPYFLYQSLPV